MRRAGSGLVAATLVALFVALPSFAGEAAAKHTDKAPASRHRARGDRHTTAPGESGPVSETNQAVASGTGGAVASMDFDASKAGIQVLKQGGNAIDAAVATASTLGDTIPFVAGPGGGGFMVIYLARSHKVVTIDGRETCPSASSDCSSGGTMATSASSVSSAIRASSGLRP